LLLLLPVSCDNDIHRYSIYNFNLPAFGCQSKLDWESSSRKKSQKAQTESAIEHTIVVIRNAQKVHKDCGQAMLAGSDLFMQNSRSNLQLIGSTQPID